MKYPRAASRRVVFALAGLTVTIGCGTHSTPVSETSVLSPDLTGSWLFTDAGLHAVLAAGIHTSAGAISGSGTVYGCGSTPEQTIVSGTATAAGEVTLDTATLSGGTTLHLRGKRSADRQSVGGTLAAVGGGCRAETVLGVKGHVYAPAQGSYTGTFTGSDGVSTPVAAVLSQSAAFGPGGSYTLGGSVAFPNSPCLDTAAIDSTESTVTGGTLSATYTATVSGQQVTITAVGTTDPSAANIAITGWTIRGGSCDGYSGTGALTLR